MSSEIMYSTFSQPEEPVSISIYENDGTTTTHEELETRAFTEAGLFIEHINTAAPPKLRIVSTNSITSVTPLRISKKALESLRDKYNLSPNLWDLTSTFGKKPLSAAAGEGTLRVHDNSDGAQEVSYRFTFPVTGGHGRWTLRQAGIFHRHNPKNQENLWMFFNAGSKTPIQKELASLASKSQLGLSADTAWFTLHQIALSYCLDDWRSYVDYLGNEVDRYFGNTLRFINESMTNTPKADGNGNLADIHNIRDRLLEIPPRLTSTLTTLQKLDNLSSILSSQQKNKNNGFGKLAKSAAYYKEHLEPLAQGIDIIKERVKDTLNMIEIGLSLRMTSKMLDLNNQMVNLNQNTFYANTHLVRLGDKNFDDNATVKIVTLVTLVYLPASLVSSILGMELFNFDDDTGEFRISKKFWIFVVATIVLAIITLTGWFLWRHKEEVHRRKFHLFKQEPPEETEHGNEIEMK